MLEMLKRLVPVVSILVPLLASPAFAAEGRFPVYQTGVTITASGSYQLTRNIPHNPSGPAIVIAAREVTLDLNGFVIDQGPNGVDPAILVTEPKADVLIRNGRIIAGADGIRFAGALTSDPDESIRFADLHIEAGSGGSCIDVSNVSTVTVEHSAFRGCDTGVRVACPGCGSRATEGRILDSAFLQTREAIRLDGVRGFEVTGNEVLNQSGAGAAITAQDSTALSVQDNTLAFGGIDLVNVQGARVEGNVVEGRMSAGTFGIRDDGSCRSNRYAGNTLEDVDLDGLLILGSNHLVADNVANHCGGFGIHLDTSASGVFYRGNLAAGNAGSSCSSPVGSDACLDGSGHVSGGDNVLAGALQ